MSVSETLREAIHADPRTRHGISQAAGTPPTLLRHFAADRRDIRVSSVDKIANELGLELRPKRDE